jgi:ACS family glucarate transporter-like MFS transporter
MPDSSGRTNVRYLILIVTALVAVFMYVDRACLSLMKDDIQRSLDISSVQIDWIMSAFFWSYALAQVPAGLLGLRFGLRWTLAIMLFTWSVCTIWCGLTTGFVSLFVARMAVGMAEAGAYPTAAAIVKGWFPTRVRGRANSIVALGGRLGFALAMIATPWLIGLGMYWWSVLILYGVLGCFWASVFVYVVRDTPSQHPWCNKAEADYPDAPPLDPTKSLPRWPVLHLATSRNMLFFGVVQFCINIGWVYLLTNFPDHLRTKFPDLSRETRGLIASLPAWASIVGMFLGGFIGDGAVRAWGLRRGRSFPIALMLAIAGCTYLLCTVLDDPWHLGLALAGMAICVDICMPSIWAFSQDVGGRYVGAALGWGNMFGNLGGAASPLLLGWIYRTYDSSTMFMVCGGLFFLAALAALALNATKTFYQEETA